MTSWNLRYGKTYTRASTSIESFQKLMESGRLEKGCKDALHYVMAYGPLMGPVADEEFGPDFHKRISDLLRKGIVVVIGQAWNEKTKRWNRVYDIAERVPDQWDSPYPRRLSKKDQELIVAKAEIADLKERIQQLEEELQRRNQCKEQSYG